MSADLERMIQQDFVFQQRIWRAQRIGWIIMIVLLLCALAGFVGQGPAIPLHGENHFHLTVSYDGVDRDQSSMEMQLSATTRDGKDSFPSNYRLKGARSIQ